MQPKLPEVKKSILVLGKYDNDEPQVTGGGEETEISAQVTIPQDGGWAWVVVAAAATGIFILDGVVFSFGAILPDLISDFNSSNALIALINSVSVGLYLFLAPLASAIINRFGFRVTLLFGSVISSFSLFISHFASSYAYLFVFYGIIPGFGYALINMSCGLVVGFYFEKYRSLAIAIVSTGSSIGVSLIFPLNAYLVELAGWRATTLLHSGMFGFIYFLAFTFRPLLSLSVVITTDNEPTKTTAYLPSVANITAQSKLKQDTIATLKPTATEKLFSAVGNENFPTAAAVVDEGTKVMTSQATSPLKPGTSTGGVSKLTITPNKPQGGLSRRELKQVQSIASRTNQHDGQQNTLIDISQVTEPEQKKRGFWARLFNWESNSEESRPLYRDDAFYQGNLEKLPQYQKSVMQTPANDRIGIEYQLAVSRATATSDLKDRRGIFTTAARRVLATMMDPTLLKRNDFLLSCSSGFLAYLGYLVPFVYIKDRNSLEGIESTHCALFVSTIGVANAFGRFILGALACKIDSIYLLIFSMSVSGISTMLSMLSYNMYYQYVYCTIFGFFIAGVSPLRVISIVDMIGLEKLTNAMGILLIFQGLASVVSTPLAGAIKETWGYTVSFIVAGCFITLSGVAMIPIKLIKVKNTKELSNKDNKSVPQ